MKKLRLFNNILIVLSIVVDFTLLFKDLSSNTVSYSLICISFMFIILLPKIFKFVFRFNMKSSIELLYLLFIILAQLFGCIFHWYSEIYWYDSFTHFISGMLTSFLAIIILKKLNHYNNKDILFNIIFIVAITLMIASLWEVFEFSSDKILNGDTQKVLLTGVDDTMKDIICALGGSVLFIIYYIYDSFNKKYLDNIL